MITHVEEACTYFVRTNGEKEARISVGATNLYKCCCHCFSNFAIFFRKPQFSSFLFCTVASVLRTLLCSLRCFELTSLVILRIEMFVCSVRNISSIFSSNICKTNKSKLDSLEFYHYPVICHCKSLNVFYWGSKGLLSFNRLKPQTSSRATLQQQYYIVL